MRALVCVGSNCGDRQRNVLQAVEWLAGYLDNLSVSSVYASDTEYYDGEKHTCLPANETEGYYNCVMCGDFHGEAQELVTLFKTYESEHGRDEECRRLGLVPVDIDLVGADGEILRHRDWESRYFIKGFRQLAKPARSFYERVAR